MATAAEGETLLFRRLDAAEAERCVPLSAAAGWGHTAAEWRGRLASGAGFGAEAHGRLVAAGVLLPGSETTAYFGLLLTEPAWRGRGLGAAITRMALEEAARQGAGQVVLFAVARARPIYLRLGFVDMGLALLSHWRDAGAPAAAGATLVRPLAPEEQQAAFALDEAAYGAARGAALAAQIERDPGRALALGPPGAPLGFGLATSRKDHLLIGPIVAPDAVAALMLVDGLGSGADRPVRLDSLGLPDGERVAFLAGLRARGFALRSEIPLMVRGAMPSIPYPRPELLFAAQSAATG